MDPRLADDAAFDVVYPARIRNLSRRFWTPVPIARRAARMFRDHGARRVLDVGAGVGKFVLAAAAAEPSIEFLGIEQRSNLVEIAENARTQLGVRNAELRNADVTRVSWESFDGFYFFNPLAENLFSPEDRIDDGVELGEARFARDLVAVESALKRAALGTVVVTYHGSSTRIPGCYELEEVEQAGSDWLRVWTKRRDAHDVSYFVESDDGSALRVDVEDGGHVRFEQPA